MDDKKRSLLVEEREVEEEDQSHPKLLKADQTSDHLACQGSTTSCILFQKTTQLGYDKRRSVFDCF